MIIQNILIFILEVPMHIPVPHLQVITLKLLQSRGRMETQKVSTPSPLYGALDRFAQFFTNPLFLDSSLDSGLKAVDSENKKDLQDDVCRLSQLNKSLSIPKHPYCHLSTGNLEVLKIQPESRGINIRGKIMEFYDEHYSANRMKLVILGREPLDKLESWATDLFASIPDKNLPRNRWEDEQPYGPEQLLTKCFAKPVMDSRTLNISIPFIDEELLFESQPSRYLAHLIGHKWPGSIMAYIKSKGWANALSAGQLNSMDSMDILMGTLFSRKSLIHANTF